MTESASAEPVASVFQRRLLIVTACMVMLVLFIHLLEKFHNILQPLFIAAFLGFLIKPMHDGLVKRRVPSMLAYAAILVIVLLSCFVVGRIVYSNLSQVADRLPYYEDRAESVLRRLAEKSPWQVPDLKGHFLREISVSPEQAISALQTTLGRFGDFLSAAAFAFIYLIFMVAEKVSFPARLRDAFGEVQSVRILGVLATINQAIAEYVSVKTSVSLMAAGASYFVLMLFGVDFAMTWAILIFVLNFIPYLGSLIAVSLPIALSFVQLPEPWQGIVVAVLLVGIQQGIGAFIEPRMAGKKLDVSPLLILLSLAFWGVVWGVTGMILAVPLLVIARIVFDNIPETKPLGKLISNM
jgi:AI-2 transport protein TqsA